MVVKSGNTLSERGKKASSWSLESRTISSSGDDSFMDVEYESVLPEGTKEKKRREKPDGEKTLLEIALDDDPDWKDIEVPFVQDQRHIDCKLAITTKLDGIVYGIGLPFHHPVFCVLQKNDGKETEIVDPDDDENEELLNIMAGALHKHMGEDLSLRRTPRILTIEGDLGKYVDNWQEDVFGLSKERVMEAIEDDDEAEMGADFLFDFFREELGDEEVDAVLSDDSESILDDIPQNMIDAFSIPGFGTEEHDVDGFEKEILEQLSNPEKELKEFEKITTDYDDSLVKLVGFEFGDGDFYSLAKPMRDNTCTLVGRKSDDTEELVFELLSAEEEMLVIPRLQDACMEELRKSGISLSTTPQQNEDAPKGP